MKKFLKLALCLTAASLVFTAANSILAAETDNSTYYYEDFNSGWKIGVGESSSGKSDYHENWTNSGNDIMITHGGTEEDGYFKYDNQSADQELYNVISSEQMLPGFDWKGFRGRMVFSFDIYVPTKQELYDAGVSNKGRTALNSLPSLKYHYKVGGETKSDYITNAPTFGLINENVVGENEADVFSTCMAGDTRIIDGVRVVYDEYGNPYADEKPNGNVSSGSVHTMRDTEGQWVNYMMVIDKEMDGDGTWRVKNFINGNYLVASRYNTGGVLADWYGGSYFKVTTDFLKDVGDYESLGFTFTMDANNYGVLGAIDNISLRVYEAPMLKTSCEVAEGSDYAEIKILNTGVSGDATDDARSGYLLLDSISENATFEVVEYQKDDATLANPKPVKYSVLTVIDSKEYNGIQKLNDGSTLKLKLDEEIKNGLSQGKRYGITLIKATDLTNSHYNIKGRGNTRQWYTKEGKVMETGNTALLWQGEPPLYLSMDAIDTYGNKIESGKDYYKANKFSLVTTDTVEKTYDVYKGDAKLETTQVFSNGVYEISLASNKIIGANGTLTIKSGDTVILNAEIPDTDIVTYSEVNLEGKYPSFEYCNPTDDEREAYIVYGYRDGNHAELAKVSVDGPFVIAPSSNAVAVSDASVPGGIYNAIVYDGARADIAEKDLSKISVLPIDEKTAKTTVSAKLGADNKNKPVNFVVYKGNWGKNKPETEKAARDSIVYVKSVSTDEYGDCDLELLFENYPNNRYTIAAYVDNSVYFTVCSYADKEDALNALAELNRKTKGEFAEYIDSDEVKLLLQFDYDVYENLTDKAAAANMMYSEKNGEIKSINDASALFRECSLIQGFNEGKIDNIQSVLNDITICNGTAFGKWLNYRDNVNAQKIDAWKVNITERMNASKSVGIDDFNKKLYIATAFAMISNPESVDTLYDFLMENISNIGLDKAYLTTSTVRKLCGTIYSGFNADALNEDLKKYYNEYSYQGGSGAGGSGGNRGGSSNNIKIERDVINTATPTPIIESTDEKCVFVDMDAFSWAVLPVNELYNRKIINGKDEKIFMPNDNVTREEFTKMVIEMLGLQHNNSMSKFDDVTDKDWFASYVNAALENGIVSGISESEFGAGRNITRQDMAVMLMNSVNYMEKTIDEKDDGFSDINDVSDYAIEAVKKLSGIGIINGYDDGTFKPQNTANRAEAAKIIYAVIKTFNL